MMIKNVVVGYCLWVWFVVVSMAAGCPGFAAAGDGEVGLSGDDVEAPWVKNLVRGRVVLVPIFGVEMRAALGMGLGYERVFLPWLSVGATINSGWLNVGSDADNIVAIGGEVMTYFMTATTAHKWVLGVGLSVDYFANTECLSLLILGFGRSSDAGSSSEKCSVGLNPALTYGYRYLPSEGGLFVEAGLGMHGGFFFNLEASAGYAF